MYTIVLSREQPTKGEPVMAFSSAERERRDRTMQRIMETRGLKALILFGEVNVGNELYGDLRYYVDHKNVANRQVAMLFPAMQPVLFVGSPIQQQAAARRSSGLARQCGTWCWP
jgi:hypothetical protein